MTRKSRQDVVPSDQRSTLAKLESARSELEQASTLTDIKAIRDVAEQVRQYAKVTKQSQFLQNRAAEVKIRAERKAGQFLADMPDIKPGRPKLSHDATINLPDLGINRNQSSRWQRIASLPDDELEEIITPLVDETVGKDQELTSHLILKRVKQLERLAEQRAADAAKQAVAPGEATITQADQADWLPKQPDCDLLITDPPYATDVDDIATFAAWLPTALKQVKPTGRAYICIGAYPEELHAYLSQPTAGLELVDVLVWTYRNTLGPSSPNRYTRNWQAILHYLGPDAPPLNTTELNEKFAVIDINAPDGRRGERWHTWQKPDDLAERLIRHATHPGDTILDPFAGTGTFLLAAARLGRHAAGCDPDPDMIDIATQRGCRHV